MALETNVRIAQPLAAPRNDARQFRWLYAVTFAICLAMTVLSRLFVRRRSGVHKSIIEEAKARTSRIVPFFFMG